MNKEVEHEIASILDSINILSRHATGLNLQCKINKVEVDVHEVRKEFEKSNTTIRE